MAPAGEPVARTAGRTDRGEESAARAEFATAGALIKAGQPEKGWAVLADLSERVADDPELTDRIRRAKGACARMLGEAAQALEAREVALSWRQAAAELVPEVPGHHLEWAWALIRVGKLEEAWSVLSDLSGRVADDPELTDRIRRAKGVCARMLGEAAQALEAHDAAAPWRQAAAELVPEVPSYRLAWAWALIKVRKREEAWSVLSDLCGQVADDPDLTDRIRQAMGVCAEGLAAERELSVEGNDWIEASQWRLEAIRHAPERMINWERYAFDLVYGGKSAEAMALIANPPSPQIGETLTDTIGDMPRYLQAQVDNGAYVYKGAAPRYLARGLPVVPALGKVVIPCGWRAWRDRLPDDGESKRWLAIPWANIGLVLGPQSGVCVIDSDTDDARLVEILDSILPPSPWRRVGRKGVALAYRWTGLTAMCCVENRSPSLVELYLCAHAHMLLPPSLHPLTGQPYRANCELLDVLDGLPALPGDFAEQLTRGFEASGYEVRLHRTN